MADNNPTQTQEQNVQTDDYQETGQKEQKDKQDDDQEDGEEEQKDQQDGDQGVGKKEQTDEEDIDDDENLVFPKRCLCCLSVGNGGKKEQNQKQEQDKEDLYTALMTQNEKKLETLLEDEEVVALINTPGTKSQDGDNSTIKSQLLVRHLPLTLAALKYNEIMIKYLLDKGAKIRNKSVDEREDNVLHSLVRHAEKHPDEITKITKIFFYLVDSENKYDSPGNKSKLPLWLEKNGEYLTVLSLAVAKGVDDIVRLIIARQNMICSKNPDEFEYHDITNIDSVTNKISENETQGQSNRCKRLLLWLRNRWKGKTYPPSVFEMLAYNEMGNEKAHAILQIKTIKVALTERWDNARKCVRVWMIIHFLCMILMTVYSAFYADAVKRNTQVSIGFEIPTAIFGAIYLAISLLSLSHKLVGPCKRSYWSFNFVYILIIFIFGVCTLFHVVKSVKFYFLISSLIMGWLFMTFFLSTFQYFSFFTVMFKRVFIRNLVSYSLVMAFHLISFTTVMYMMLKTGNEDHAFEDVLFMMFKLMVGLSELEDAGNSESPGFSYFIYIVFVVITYIVLMNALIAMMSEIFVSLNVEFQLHQWRLEQLYTLLFLEETLFLFFLEKFWKRPRKGSKFVLKYRKYPVDKEQESLVPKPPKSNKKQLKSPKKVEFQHSMQYNINSITELRKYVLTNRSGLPLATVVAQNAQDSKTLLHSNGENVIEVETHTPGEKTLFNVEPKLTLRIRLKEEELIHNEPKNKVHPSPKPEEDDNELSDQSCSGVTKYFFINKYSKQILATVYEHEPRFPIAPDIFNGAFVIDVETHSPGLIILDDPDKGRKLIIEIEQQHFDDTSLA